MKPELTWGKVYTHFKFTPDFQKATDVSQSEFVALNWHFVWRAEKTLNTKEEGVCMMSKFYSW